MINLLLMSSDIRYNRLVLRSDRHGWMIQVRAKKATRGRFLKLSGFQTRKTRGVASGLSVQRTMNSHSQRSESSEALENGVPKKPHGGPTGRPFE